jgi:hypothetical protein
MNTLIIYLDESKKNARIITPHRQGFEWDSKERFDGNWQALAHHLTNGTYYKFEVI